jgi:hypothetical protein
MTQEPVPEHPPTHPEKVEPVLGVAVIITEVPTGKVVVQLFVQFAIPLGLLVTLPLPVPDVLTVSVAVLGGA